MRRPEGKSTSRTTPFRRPDSASEETALSRDDFVRRLRDALGRLYDLPYLQASPLAHLAARARGEGGLSPAQALEQEVHDAITGLASRPDPRVSQLGRLLELRYVEARDPTEVQRELGVSKSEYFREQQRAVEAIAAFLWQRWDVAGEAARLAEAANGQGRQLGAAEDGSRREAPRHNLPSRLSSFVGRERELVELQELLDGVRLLTLTGSGGCGKTRLAFELAERVLDDYPAGTWLVELAALVDPALVPQAVASALGVRETPGQPIAETLASYLSSRRLLLIIDNCEHLVEACAQLAESLLRAGRDLRVLATSREPLGVEGELAWRVPPLSGPDPEHLPQVERLLDFESTRLFVERARLVQPTFAATDQNGAALAEICRRLDGIPLALELAAARVLSLSVQQIADRLRDRLRLLVDRRRTLPRHRTLEAAIDWSHDLLAPEEAVLFRRLSVFVGSWTLEAAEAISSGEDLPPDAVIDVLDSLVRKSLVVAEPSGAGTRYHLLETVRAYGREKLQAAGESAVAQRKHRDWFLDWAERVIPVLWDVEQSGWPEQVKAEHDNLRAALDWCHVDEYGAEPELRLVTALARFWNVCGFIGEGRERVESALARAGDALPDVRIRALIWAGIFENSRGNLRRARELHEESLAISQRRGDSRWVSAAHDYLLDVAVKLGDYDEALRLGEEAVAVTRQSRDAFGLAWSLAELGFVHYRRGDYAGALPLLEESLSICRRLGVPRGTLHTTGRFGRLATALGEYARARALLEECLALSTEIGDSVGPTWAYLGLGDLARAEGSLDLASRHYRELLTAARRAGLTISVALALARLGGLAAITGQPERAARLFGAVESWYSAVGISRSTDPHPGAERDLAAAREALGEEAFARISAEGRALALEQAAEYALQVDPALS